MNRRLIKLVAGVIHRACSPETQAMLVDNLLGCDFIDGPLSNVQKQPVTLHCALIEENYDTELKP